MKILTASQFKELDQYTIEHEPVSSINLMERAADALVAELVSRWTTSTRFVVFAGPGNNGGDALAVSRKLMERGYSVETYLFNPKGRLSDDCATNRNRLTAMPQVAFHEVVTEFTFPTVTAHDVLVDGLFGTGLNKPLMGGFALVVSRLNASPAFAVSIDVPSGLMTEDNSCNHPDAIVHADLTLTIQLPKLAFFLAENQPYVGQVVTVDIGLSAQGLSAIDTPIQLVEPAQVAALLQPRSCFAHKGNMGHALLVAGKYGMAGAAVLAAKACLRAGAGKVTVHTAARNNDIIQIAVPEAILSHDCSDDCVTALPPTSPYNVMAVGPGIGSHSDTAAMLYGCLNSYVGELVLDADALNILGEYPDWLPVPPGEGTRSRHPKGRERVGGQCADSYERMTKARTLAINKQIYLIIKGHYTMICTPTGRVYLNPTGNAGMATAGSGDVLTGLLAGLLAQGYPPLSACLLGVYLHGLAGDLGAVSLGQEGLMASDLIAHLPAAFRQLWELARTCPAGPSISQ